MTSTPLPPRARFAWPGGARAAVSLTYDDAVPGQRLAADDLGRRGLRGTFFLTGTSSDLKEHRGAWQALLEVTSSHRIRCTTPAIAPMPGYRAATRAKTTIARG